MRKKSRFAFIIVLGVLFTLFSPLSSALAESGNKVINLRMQHSMPPGDLSVELVVNPLMDNLEKACEGRIKFKRFTIGSLVPVEKALSAIRTGAIDFAALPLPFYGDLPDGLNMLEVMPYLFRSVEDFLNIYYDHGIVDLLREVLAKDFNAYYLGPMPSGPMGFMTSSPINTIEDFKGKKIWGPGQGLFYSCVGASAAYIPIPEVYMALKMGTIDGLIFTYPELESLKFKEVASYVSKPPIIETAPLAYLMNMDKWKALSTDIQDKFKQMVKNDVMRSYNVQMVENEKVLASPDITVIELPAKDVEYMKNFAETKVWEELLGTKGPLGRKALNIIKNYYGKK